MFSATYNIQHLNDGLIIATIQYQESSKIYKFKNGYIDNIFDVDFSIILDYRQYTYYDLWQKYSYTLEKIIQRLDYFTSNFNGIIETLIHTNRGTICFSSWWDEMVWNKPVFQEPLKKKYVTTETELFLDNIMDNWYSRFSKQQFNTKRRPK